ncbi:Crp/Fnr family transcriptional regulator [Roseivirga sp.]|uniref:Crp/Fnr family transcriptional regulator n=1 Tax=Roseivirga sp. TaxID=1964215 RepID=UPI003B51A6E0
MSQALFNHINQFTSLNKESFEQMMLRFDLLQVDKKEILSSAGSKCDQIYFVVKGCLHSYFVDDSGVEKTVKFALEDWWVTDFLAFHHQTTTEFYIQAVEPSIVLRINYSDLEELRQKYPQLESYFRNVYEIGYGAAMMRFKYIFNYSKEEIFTRFCEQFPEFVNRIPQYMLATYLGLTPEYLSKIRAKKLS